MTGRREAVGHEVTTGVRQKNTSAVRRITKVPPSPVREQIGCNTRASLPASRDRLKGGGLAIAARSLRQYGTGARRAQVCVIQTDHLPL